MIRKYGSEDGREVIQIWLEASRISHNFISYDYWYKHKEVMLSVYLPTANTFVYTNRDTLQIEGFISFVGHTICALFVSPACQGKGIGEQLIAFAKQMHQNLDLYVYCLNRKALKFYQKQGFIIRDYKTDPNTQEEQYYMVF